MILAPACKAIVPNIARKNRLQLNVPATAKPRAEPTSTGLILAVKNFGLDAKNKVLSFRSGLVATLRVEFLVLSSSEFCIFNSQFPAYNFLCVIENRILHLIRGDVEPVDAGEGFEPGPLLLGEFACVFLY